MRSQWRGIIIGKAGLDGMGYHRLIVKLGTNLITAGTPRLDLEVMAALVGQVARLSQVGKEVILVSSGAIAAGRHRLGLTKESKDVPFRQVLAAIGQSRLMQAYDQLFEWHGIKVAQTLLTKADLTDRQGYLNARNTLLALLELQVVPIVNENDVVAIDEIKEAQFGDNDNLSAMVANLIDADLLVILSDIEGLYTADPRLRPDAQLIPRVDRIDAQVERLAGGGPGRGGMITKLQAAKLATASGLPVVMAQGREPEVLPRLASGEAIGTYFAATSTRLESRKRWMLGGLDARGKVIVDEGAVIALRERKKSLLPAGVIGIEGVFERGEGVSIVAFDSRAVALGITNYSSSELLAIKGCRSDDIFSCLGYEYGAEVVHRDNLVVL